MITDNHTKAIYHVAKVKLLGVNVYLCVAKIPYSRLARYKSLLNIIGARTMQKCAPKNKSIKTSTKCRRPATI